MKQAYSDQVNRKNIIEQNLFELHFLFTSYKIVQIQTDIIKRSMLYKIRYLTKKDEEMNKSNKRSLHFVIITKKKFSCLVPCRMAESIFWRRPRSARSRHRGVQDPWTIWRDPRVCLLFRQVNETNSAQAPP